ncbi:MAG: hypothetical protein K2I70_05415 [Bacilli bacterium]|nr:hypothetical protein [Bacilli bacterium]
MSDILGELFKETTYLDPYLRQFLKYLKEKEVLIVGKNIKFLCDKIKNMGFSVESVEVINNEITQKHEAVIIFNVLNELDKNTFANFFEDTYNINKDEGLIFIINQNNKDDINYTKEFLDFVMGKKYNFIEELNNYENLKFYIYEKKHY